MCECCGGHSNKNMDHIAQIHVHGLKNEADVEKLDAELRRLPGTAPVEAAGDHGAIAFDTRFISADSLEAIIAKLGFSVHRH